MESEKSLVIIDAQVNMFDEQMPVFDADRLLITLTQLVERARNANTPVIFVRNNGAIGDPDEPGTPGWGIHPALSPQNTDFIIDKHSPDSFNNTSLQEVLHTKGITHLLVAGMQTELCINATCKRAIELGYEVTVVADAHSTFDLDNMTAAQAIMYYNTELSAIAELKKANEVVI